MRNTDFRLMMLSADPTGHTELQNVRPFRKANMPTMTNVRMPTANPAKPENATIAGGIVSAEAVNALYDMPTSGCSKSTIMRVYALYGSINAGMTETPKIKQSTTAASIA